ncbi:putative non-specific serine/threonine protein kinase [Helianthus debilis subsp. tardiflorus]
MCVQPEVSHRPFMGEVVQALKLVCNEFDEIRQLTPSTSYNRDSETMDLDYDSKIGFSTTNLRSTTESVGVLESESFRREFNSAPLQKGRKKPFWRRLRGSASEHEYGHGFSSNL